MTQERNLGHLLFHLFYSLRFLDSLNIEATELTPNTIRGPKVDPWRWKKIPGGLEKNISALKGGRKLLDPRCRSSSLQSLNQISPDFLSKLDLSLSGVNRQSEFVCCKYYLYFPFCSLFQYSLFMFTVQQRPPNLYFGVRSIRSMRCMRSWQGSQE